LNTISTDQITNLLLAWERGDESALERLMPLVMEELRRIASYYMRKERVGHTLQTTALVNEAYVRLVEQKRVQWRNRSHFFAIAATCMRRVLCDSAKSRARDKRGGGAEHVALSDAQPIAEERAAELVELDEALERLAEQDRRKGSVVEMRYFGGYSVKEIAEFLEVSETTVAREWSMARAWLRRELCAKPNMLTRPPGCV
jgi:RNA polymerase sigma-70 factor (ECF subfamily)